MNSVTQPSVAIEQECYSLCAYVMSREPNAYVLQKYAAGNIALELESLPSDRFDRLLLDAARRSSILARLADTYARFLRPQSLLRVKLQLLLAILETSPPYDKQFKSVKKRSALGALALLALYGVAFTATLLSAVVVFLPLQLVMHGRRPPRVKTLVASVLLKGP